MKIFFGNVNLTETFEGENSNNSNVSNNSQSNSTGSSNMKNLFQDTPQGDLDNTELEDQTWATNYTMNNTNNENEINDNSSSNGLGFKKSTEVIT